jgi:hypothetical protein
MELAGSFGYKTFGHRIARREQVNLFIAALLFAESVAAFANAAKQNRCTTIVAGRHRALLRLERSPLSRAGLLHYGRNQMAPATAPASPAAPRQLSGTGLIM